MPKYSRFSIYYSDVYKCTIPFRVEIACPTPAKSHAAYLDAIIANIRRFLEDTGSYYPSKRSYLSWPGRIAAIVTIHRYFDSWQQAVSVARHSPVPPKASS
jgi:hypothetical protein